MTDTANSFKRLSASEVLHALYIDFEGEKDELPVRNLSSPVRHEHSEIRLGRARGVLIVGVSERLEALSGSVAVHVVTANTLGTADVLAREIPVSLRAISHGSDKADFVASLGRTSSARRA